MPRAHVNKGILEVKRFIKYDRDYQGIIPHIHIYYILFKNRYKYIHVLSLCRYIQYHKVVSCFDLHMNTL